MKRYSTPAFAVASILLLHTSCAAPSAARASINRDASEACEDKAAAHDVGPMGLPGARVALEPVEGGVALVFSAAEPETVAELQRRVQTKMQHVPSCCQKATEVDIECDNRGCTWIRTHKHIEVTNHGARLVLMPAHADQLGALREKMDRRVEHMRRAQAKACDAEKAAATDP